MDDKTLCNAVEVEDLTVAYQIKPVLWDIDLHIPSGQLTAIVGPNGAGKTTLLKAMLGLLKPVSGSVRFPVIAREAQLPQQGKRRTRTRIGYVPQSGSVDWDFPATVLDIVLMGCYGKLGWIRRPRREDVALARRCLESVGMTAYSDRQISQLSGGQQQRVFLARALAQEAELYLMDEPFKGVDARTEATIVELLRRLRDEGRTVIVVHHDLETVPDYFDWVTLINLEIVANGPVAEVFSDSNLRATYRSAAHMLRRED